MSDDDHGVGLPIEMSLSHHKDFDVPAQIRGPDLPTCAAGQRWRDIRKASSALKSLRQSEFWEHIMQAISIESKQQDNDVMYNERPPTPIQRNPRVYNDILSEREDKRGR